MMICNLPSTCQPTNSVSRLVGGWQVDEAMKRTMNISALSTPADRFVFVNHEGKRFVAEDARRDVLRDAVLAQTKMEVFPAIDDVGFELQKNLKGPKNEAARWGGDALHREHDRRARGSALRDLEHASAAMRALRRFSVRRSVGRTRTFLTSSTCRGISSRECTRDSRL